MFQDCISKGLKANEWMKHIELLMKARGGGKDISAQATGTNIACLEEAMSLATAYAQDKLGIRPETVKVNTPNFTLQCQQKVEPKVDSPTVNPKVDSPSVNVDTLNKFLATHSYIQGYEPSQADSLVFDAMTTPASQFVHVLRWYNHIKSYGDEKLQFPGSKPNLQELGAVGLQTGSCKVKESIDDYDDFDLFGSDSEDDTEAERIKQERIKNYTEKKEK